MIFFFAKRCHNSVLKDDGLTCFSFYRCKFRVLDSFGTDAEFNYKRYKGEIPGGKSPWGDLDLHLAQFMTMYREYQFI